MIIASYVVHTWAYCIGVMQLLLLAGHTMGQAGLYNSSESILDTMSWAYHLIPEA